MKVEILGSGGALTTPRPGCDCPVCSEARVKGIPYARTGPGYFLHGPDVLFDTSEDIVHQLNRAGIGEIAAAFYSHWHPDHTMGRRVWESRNMDFRSWPPETKRTQATPIYLPAQVAVDLRRRLGGFEHLSYLSEMHCVELHELRDGERVSIAGWSFRPFPLAEDYVYAFMVEGDGRRIILAPDETNGWEPADEFRGSDLAIVPMGICEFHPLTGERLLHAEHPVLRFEVTFDETLELVRQLEARRTVLSHIEEMDGLSYEDLRAVELRLEGRVEFAYDGMVLTV
jgi:phosphoribosyl 1,2-cyclic phosphate phosphodiesterase